MLNIRLEGGREEIHALVAWLQGQGLAVQVSNEKRREHVWHTYAAVPAVPGHPFDPGPTRVVAVQGRAIEDGRPRRRPR